MNDKEARYKGEILNCIRNGKGSYKYPYGGNDIFQYHGNWNMGVKDDTESTFTAKEMFTYKGQFTDGEITGFGKKEWQDGRKYEGEWLNGEMHGKGYWKYKDEIYEGSFVDNKRNGFGILTKGTEVYKGDFLNHKFHGKGTLLSTNKFILEGYFDNNIVSGLTRVDWWEKRADIHCEWRNGLPNGCGYFTTKDLSFDFQGDFINGKPELTQSGVSLWASLDRSELDKDKKKDSKKPAAKDKKGKFTIESLASLQKGDCLGRIHLRTCFYTPPPIEPVETVPPKKDNKAAVIDDGKLKEPPLFAVLSERIRRVPVWADEEASVARFGEAVDLWVKRKSLEEVGSDRCRFPPLSLVCMCDSNFTLSWRQTTTAILAQHKPGVTPPVVSDLQPAVDSQGVVCFLLDNSVVMEAAVDVSSLLSSSSGLAVVLDIKVDCDSLAKRYMEARKNNSIGRNKVVEILFLSLTRSKKNLELILLVPRDNLKKTKTEEIPIQWTGCRWELRSTTLSEDPQVQSNCLSRWVAGDDLCVDQWSSLSLLLDSSGNDNNSNDINVELFHDGIKKMREQTDAKTITTTTVNVWLRIEGDEVLQVKVGSVEFKGGVKGFAVVGTKPDERCDFARTTACYDIWRRREQEEQQLQQEQQEEGCSEGYRITKSVEVDLFCGQVELLPDFLQIPLNTAAGMFSLIVSDCVHPDVIVVEEEEIVKEASSIKDIGELCRLVRPLKSFDDLVVTVE